MGREEQVGAPVAVEVGDGGAVGLAAARQPGTSGRAQESAAAGATVAAAGEQQEQQGGRTARPARVHPSQLAPSARARKRPDSG